MGTYEEEDGEIDHEKEDNPQPCPRKERQSGDTLSDSYGERIGNGGGKTEGHGEEAHAETGEAVPAEEVSQGHDYHYHRDHPLIDTEDRGGEHEEEDDHRHQKKATGTEAMHDAVQNEVEYSPRFKDVEGPGYEKKEQDDGVDGETVRSPEHFEGSGGPAPDRRRLTVDPFVGAGHDDLASSLDLSFIGAGGNYPGENAGAHHEDEKNNDGGEKCPSSDGQAARAFRSFLRLSCPVFCVVHLFLLRIRAFLISCDTLRQP